MLNRREKAGIKLKKLARAVEEGRDTIEIEEDLATKTIKIKATGKVAWAVAIGAIGVALAALLASGGVAAPTSGVVAAGAVGVLGLLSHYFSTSNCFYSWWSGGTQ
ncbi:hypothetical protein NHP194003_07240 [Helicobacter suis]|uniref:Uncharacterized protein n=1 Tax=Helicobacter suis TaxID=104628 RepID=A0ABM7L1H9_9HELI|nr:hypothetical protein [Helicobacter suis]BCD46571.1 hypothetical protein NHP190020_16100 [Helicobacter suis]BCD47520.1 hypothetical protein NHP194003_07240 [Helicobacter suis]BCD49274.1 hypothetical protein NHP194004_07210 [Helicobacter suis]BCD51307.1 hypothetical protein NHP194022_09780 [Helicobacter suis]BDR28039.1 hypothetical protein HSHS1_08000 [Helicobacter suis HS1]